MKILAFETSAKTASVALLEDDRLIAEYSQNSGLTHSRTLMKMAENLLADSSCEIADINAVAVAAGPGSFTGVRIGVAAAKGLAWGGEIPCYGVSTLEAMVRSAAMCDGRYCCCMDARRNQVYNAVFDVAGDEIIRLCDDRGIEIETLAGEIDNYENPVFLVGDGASLCYNTLKERMDKLLLLPEHLRYQKASGVGLAAWAKIKKGESGSASELVPNYLRLSQAERERLSKLQNV